jgi:hypothetical protein
MKKCKSCMSEIDNKAKKCPKCQADQRNWFRRHPILTGILVLVVIGIVGSVSGGSKNNQGNTGGNSSQASQQQEQANKFNIDDIYSKIESGMTEDQVKEIITKDPINCTESEMQGVGTSKVCTYGNVFLDKGAIVVTYLNGKVNTKTKSQY